MPCPSFQHKYNPCHLPPLSADYYKDCTVKLFSFFVQYTFKKLWLLKKKGGVKFFKNKLKSVILQDRMLVCRM
jgi:hypothetical protein